MGRRGAYSAEEDDRPRRRRDDEDEDEEVVEIEEEEIPIRLADGEAQIWAGFYASIVSGAAAGNHGKPVDLEILAFEADEMLRHFRARDK